MGGAMKNGKRTEQQKNRAAGEGKRYV